MDNNTIIEEPEDINRLEHAYNTENQKPSSKGKINSDNIKDSLYKSLYLKTKDSKDDISEIDFMIGKMSHIGKKSHDLLYTLNPDHVNPRIETKRKENKKEKKKSTMTVPSIAALGLGGLIVSNKMDGAAENYIVNPAKKLYNKLFKKENSDKDDVDESNIFGLTESDKGILAKLQGNTNRESKILDTIVRKFSLGGIPSFVSLLFGFGPGSPILKFFFDKIKLYGQTLYDLFVKVIKKCYNFVKEAVLNPDGIVGSVVGWIGNVVHSNISLFVEREHTSAKFDRVESNPINKSGFDFAAVVHKLTFGLLGRPAADDEYSNVDSDSTNKKSSLNDLLNLKRPDASDGSASNIEFGSGNFDPGQSVSAAALASAKVYPIGNGRWASNNPILNRFIAAESMGNPKAGNKSYKGLMQMGPKEARTWGVSNIWDAQQNFEGGKKYAMYHARELEKRGIPVTALTLYLAHQQGLGGITAIWKASKGQAQLPAEIRSNMNNNGGSGKSPAEFMAYWSRRIESDHNTFATKYSGAKFLGASPQTSEKQTAKPMGDSLDNPPPEAKSQKPEESYNIVFPTSILPPEEKVSKHSKNNVQALIAKPAPTNFHKAQSTKHNTNQVPKTQSYSVNSNSSNTQNQPTYANRTESSTASINKNKSSISVWEEMLHKDLTGNMMA